MDDGGSPDWVQRLQRERDLCLRILSLGTRDDLDPFVEEALALIVEVTGADVGYLELSDTDDEAALWCAAVGCSDEQVEEIRARTSRGIIAEALGSGKTIQTDSALSDARFNMHASVRTGRIEAVLCAPVGGDAALGVVYLQARSGAGAFSDADRQLTELFALHIAPFVARLVLQRRVSEASDPTHGLRQSHRLDGIVGRSAALAAVLEQAMLAAPLDVNVLITGDSGTGKSQLARAIHDNSRRSAGPFVELNCAALPETLVESELFGAVAGSHSEARVDRAGKVAAAEGGTLFLDEVGELPLAAQSKLLQLLQSHEYYPLGATRPRLADIRVIAATNADLEEAMGEKRFRRDLFYRLQVLPLRLPSLTERREDVPELARALLARACKEHRLAPVEISRPALHAIALAEWPGNVRQLENAIQAAAVRALGSRSREIGVPHLFPERASDPGVAIDAAVQGLTFQDATREFQRRLLAAALADSGWNVREVARRLEMSRAHVYNLIKAFGLERSPHDDPEHDGRE